MDLRPTATQQEFRYESREWLRQHVPTQRLPAIDTQDGVQAHQSWERQLYDAGYAAVHWPREYGGRGASPLDTMIFYEEYVAAKAPERLNRLGLGMVGPILMEHGTLEQKARWLPRILSCDDLWCQGFSEPEAGSDLASLRTSAVREDDRCFVVNGQKIWTSMAPRADWMFALVRTDPAADKRHGITFLMIDMRSDGIEIRPIRQLNGALGFAEVFFSDVRVPAANVIGQVNQGWAVAMRTLAHERGAGLNTHVHFLQLLDELVELIRSNGRDLDTLTRHDTARAFVDIQLYKHNLYHSLTRASDGEPSGAESSFNKLFWSQMQTRMYELGLDVLDDRAEVLSGKPAWQQRYWHSRASLIYAGSTEIQKNTIAERVLGLPKEDRR